MFTLVYYYIFYSLYIIIIKYENVNRDYKNKRSIIKYEMSTVYSYFGFNKIPVLFTVVKK